jgi:hypothetical protein
MTAFPTPTGLWEPLSVSATLEEHIRKVPPPRLYHYCDTKALIGIAENKVLWATDLNFLNDEAEREHGVELIRKKIAEFEKEDPGLFQELGRQTNMRGAAPINRVFLASFTEEVTLPMFRMYCPADGGYCLRLPTSQIRDLVEPQRFRLVKCTPYYKFKLRSPEYPDLIRISEPENSLHVFLGPANTNQERRRLAAQWLFQQNVGPVGTSIFPTTYR